jgi:phage terminase large subunit-like protein
LVASASFDLASPVSLMRSLGLEPSLAQATFLSSAGPRACFSGGRGAGKTTAGLVLALHTALATPSRRVLVVAPTIRDARGLLERLAGMLRWTDCDFHAHRMEVLFLNVSEIKMFGATSGADRFRGYCRDLVVVDQAEKVPVDVKEALAGLIRPGSRLVALEDA